MPAGAMHMLLKCTMYCIFFVFAEHAKVNGIRFCSAWIPTAVLFLSLQASDRPAFRLCLHVWVGDLSA
jgi:hypothetical protein